MKNNLRVLRLLLGLSDDFKSLHYAVFFHSHTNHSIARLSHCKRESNNHLYAPI